MMSTPRFGLFALCLFLVSTGASAQSDAQVAVDGACLDCHSDLEVDSRARPHAPFADRDCTSCHNPHASRYSKLLRKDTRELCGDCHVDVDEQLDRPYLHRPVEEGQCAACHEPHASEHPALLRSAATDLCSTCHAQVAEWKNRRIVHAPVEDGCSNCHEAHGAERRNLLVDAPDQICSSCHDDADVTSAHPTSGILGTDCTACHDPHASNKSSLLRANEHPPFAEQKCSLCHSASQPDAPFAVAEVEVVCQRCHPEAREFDAWSFRHILDRDDSCTQCHNPHTSNASHLLSSEEEQLCTTCHFVEDRGADSKSLTHPGVACSECHLPHGADNDRYLRAAGSPELCTPCHDRAAHSSHPVGEKILDPRSGRPVSCLSCHQLHAPAYEKYLPLDPDRELCVQCHRK